MVICFVLCTVGLEFYRQEALKLYNSIYVIPMIEIGIILVGTFVAGLFFGELVSMEKQRFISCMIFLAVTILGVIFISIGVRHSKLAKQENTSMYADILLKHPTPIAYKTVPAKTDDTDAMMDNN